MHCKLTRESEAPPPAFNNCCLWCSHSLVQLARGVRGPSSLAAGRGNIASPDKSQDNVHVAGNHGLCQHLSIGASQHCWHARSMRGGTSESPRTGRTVTRPQAMLSLRSTYSWAKSGPYMGGVGCVPTLISKWLACCDRSLAIVRHLQLSRCAWQSSGRLNI